MYSTYEPQQQQRQQQLNDYEQLRQAEERDTQFKSLEKDIVDVNSIFKDLAILVHDQGEIIGNYQHI